MKIIFTLLLIPCFAGAQILAPVAPVEPILSNDYLKLIGQNKKENSYLITDTTNSIEKSKIRQKKYINFTYYPIRELFIRKNQLFAKRNFSKNLGFSFSYTMNAGIKIANQQPELQKDYVQGSNSANAIRWQGPETNEAFSFGPDIRGLQFDGSSYLYDQNGRLIPQTDGINPATAYHNNIIKNGAVFSNSIHAQTRLSKMYNNFWDLAILFGNATEQLIVPNNKNDNNNISVSITRKKEKFNLVTNYTHATTCFSNANNNGYLNKIYQYSLLTPISFDNEQNKSKEITQKRFYNGVDNPYFLLENNANPYKQFQNKYSVHFNKNYGKFHFSVAPDLDYIEEKMQLQYPVNTAGFVLGKAINRNKKDKNFSIHSNAKYTRTFGRIKTESQIGYMLHQNQTYIDYSKDVIKNYSYKRFAQEANINLLVNSDWYSGADIGIQLSNKIYTSNSTKKNDFFLPSFNTYFLKRNLFNSKLDLRLVATYNTYANEIPVSRSFAYAGLLQHNTTQANAFFPVNEIAFLNKIDLIQHRDISFLIDLTFKYKLNFSAEWFNRVTKNDVFPVNQNNQLLLKNIANHRTNGIEFELSHNRYLSTDPKLQFSNILSFTHYHAKITDVVNGYDQLPIAGFSNIHKAIIKGETMGAIVGSSFLKDANGQNIIGTDGFPLADNQLKKIGNVIPNFILKMNNRVGYRKFTFGIDWEWKNGGQQWNGTQAVLDYYGRSANSGKDRNIENYIFSGVTQTGANNNKAVRFYDAALPLNQNRWVRYGYTGIAEAYIQKADQLRIQTFTVGYQKYCKKNIQQYSINLYCENLVIWSPYKGVDVNQLLFDQPNSSGLDFFNLPSTKYFGVKLTFKY